MATPSDAAGSGYLPGIAGKLPAHGDFVRRGGPAAVLALLDRWLDTELGAVVAAGMPLDEAVDALDGWRFAFATPDASVLVTVIASTDRVGRSFPLVGAITDMGNGGCAIDAAERWCATAGDALAAVRDAVTGADTALAAIAAIDPPVGKTMSGESAKSVAATGWWQAGDATPTGAALLPTGAAFQELLAGVRA